MTIWALWFARNKLIYEDVVQQVQDVITFIRGYEREYRVVNKVLKHPAPDDLS